MSSLRTQITLGEVQNLGIYEAATLDGYWEHKALEDLQLVYLKGQLRATESFHASYGNNGTRLRLKRLKKEIKAIEDTNHE